MGLRISGSGVGGGGCRSCGTSGLRGLGTSETECSKVPSIASIMGLTSMGTITSKQVQINGNGFCFVYVNGYVFGRLTTKGAGYNLAGQKVSSGGYNIKTLAELQAEGAKYTTSADIPASAIGKGIYGGVPATQDGKSTATSCDSWWNVQKNPDMGENFIFAAKVYKAAGKTGKSSVGGGNAFKNLGQYLVNVVQLAKATIPTSCYSTWKNKLAVLEAQLKNWRDVPTNANNMTDANFLDLVSYAANIVSHPGFAGSQPKLSVFTQMMVFADEVNGQMSSGYTYIPGGTDLVAKGEYVGTGEDDDYLDEDGGGAPEEEEDKPWWKSPLAIFGGAVVGAGLIYVMVRDSDNPV